MAKGPSDIGEKNMALKQENMASNQKRTGPGYGYPYCTEIS